MRYRWVGFWPLLASLPFIYWIAMETGSWYWLGLAILPALVGVGLLGTTSGAVLMGLAALMYLYASLRAPHISYRLWLWFQLVVLGLAWGIQLLFRFRQQQEEHRQHESFTHLEERLILAREQYKTDLVVNLSNQKKMQKYFLLSRVSRVFGSQLELSKLADVVIREMRDIMGADRGRYLAAFLPPGSGGPPLVRCLPPDMEPAELLRDQFGEWCAQHRTTLLVTDAHKDFRFRLENRETQARSLLLAPLLADGKYAGLLRAESVFPGMFTVADSRLFSIVADLAGAAAENANLYQRTQELAITDGLTGLYLRRFFNHRLEEELNRQAEHGTPFTLIMLDLDHFKRINDRFGHLAGDEVLVRLAQTLRQEARLTDILCRFGGEEFALLLPSTQCGAGLAMAERIRSRIAQNPIQVLGDRLSVTVSLGVSGCPDHGTSAGELIKAADDAMYEAKRSGRNRIVAAERLS